MARDTTNDCGLINVEEIVKKHLTDNGYDGLYHDSDCGCHVDNLAPCDVCCLECRPGVNDPEKCKSENVDFWICPKDGE